MAKTRIYLDVDGVINAIPAAKDIIYRSGWPKFESTYVGRYLITYAPELLRRLERLHDWQHWAPDTDEVEDSVEIVWLTTWREKATADLSPAIGFNATHWRVVSDGEGAHGYRKLGFSDYSYWWKVDNIIKDLIERPVDYVVWLDDDQPHYNRSVTSVIKKFNTTQFLTIAPLTEVGLTSDHLDLIDTFVRRAQDDDGSSRIHEDDEFDVLDEDAEAVV